MDIKPVLRRGGHGVGALELLLFFCLSKFALKNSKDFSICSFFSSSVLLDVAMMKKSEAKIQIKIAEFFIFFVNFFQLRLSFFKKQLFI